MDSWTRFCMMEYLQRTPRQLSVTPLTFESYLMFRNSLSRFFSAWKATSNHVTSASLQQKLLFYLKYSPAGLSPPASFIRKIRNYSRTLDPSQIATTPESTEKIDITIILLKYLLLYCLDLTYYHLVTQKVTKNQCVDRIINEISFWIEKREAIQEE